MIYLKYQRDTNFFFIKNTKILKNNSFITKKNISIKNIFFNIINFFFKKNLKNKFFTVFMHFFNEILNFLFFNKNELNLKYSYFNFIKKNFLVNKWILNFNIFFLWLFSNYELLFFFKKNSYKAKHSIFSFYYIIKKKRKNIFLKWINNKIHLTLKNKLKFKYLYFYLELILNYKNSSFFNFKNLIYKNILLN